MLSFISRLNPHPFRLLSLLILFFGLLATGCSGDNEPASEEPEVEVGVASYYADGLHGNLTSTAERYDREALTAASKDYPYNTVLEVTNLSNETSVRVRVNDCGPHHPNRIIDLSKAAAREIDLLDQGTARVSLEVIELGSDGPICNR